MNNFYPLVLFDSMKQPDQDGYPIDGHVVTGEINADGNNIQVYPPITLNFDDRVFFMAEYDNPPLLSLKFTNEKDAVNYFEEATNYDSTTNTYWPTPGLVVTDCYTIGFPIRTYYTFDQLQVNSDGHLILKEDIFSLDPKFKEAYQQYSAISQFSLYYNALYYDHDDQIIFMGTPTLSSDSYVDSNLTKFNVLHMLSTSPVRATYFSPISDPKQGIYLDYIIYLNSAG
ncbi:hypothetical protein [Xenorhabdus bharatensis]|uniref:hypothetical protein n=1 Tax=Xenorhabdus bharatensis TaxID=3136256 RepID=UPI0030F45B52